MVLRWRGGRSAAGTYPGPWRNKTRRRSRPFHRKGPQVNDLRAFLGLLWNYVMVELRGIEPLTS